MDIFILSDGKETGPFSEETAQTLLNQGTVSTTDLAWRTGMDDWAPLREILPLPSDPPTATDQSGQSDPEPATAKQRAFLEYLAISIPGHLSKEHASVLLNDAMDNPAFAQRIGKWSVERLRLHPDLFAAEVHARKENRANHFFEVCQTEGSQFFTRITKAHCQVLVAFLDAKFPAWDSRMEDAATNFFFPAIAEKFPQLIERPWRGRFHYVEEPGTEPIRRATTSRIRKPHSSPLEAVALGFTIGVAILGALYFGQRMIPHWMGRQSAEKEPSEYSSPAPSSPPGATSTGHPKPAEHSAKEKMNDTSRKNAPVEEKGGASSATPAHL
jgi:GYF domain 2